MKWQRLSVTIRLAAGFLALVSIGSGALMLSWFFEKDMPREYWGFAAAMFGGVVMGCIFALASVFGRSPDLSEFADQETRRK